MNEYLDGRGKNKVGRAVGCSVGWLVVESLFAVGGVGSGIR